MTEARALIVRVGRCAMVAAMLSLPGCGAPPKPADRAPPGVDVLAVHAVDVPISASLYGEIAAQVQQDLSFRAGGQITDLAVDVGAHVTKDQVLAHIDPRELQAGVDLAAASVSSAAALQTQAQANFDRQKSLFAQGNTTKAGLDAAQTALDTANNALAGARAQAASAQETLGYAALTATSDGIIVARSAEIGQVVQAAQPVFRVAADGPRDAIFQTFERGLAGVGKDVVATIALVSDAKITASGHVREYSPTLDASTGTVRIKVGLDPGAPAFALGAAVTGSVPLPARHGFALPWSALFRDANGPAVWVLDPATNTVALHAVVVDRYLDDKVVVADGLTDGQTIVAKGLQLLRPGEKVTPKVLP